MTLRLIQIGLGVARAGFIAAFFPSSVIKGLLAAIGVILILKQVPHVLGHDTDPVGDLAFEQLDKENTFTELLATAFDIHSGAALVGLVSIAVLVIWDKVKFLKAAWDAIGSEFGSRHTQYEMFYAGARFVTAGHSYRTFDWEGANGMVDHLMATYDISGGLSSMSH